MSSNPKQGKLIHKLYKSDYLLGNSIVIKESHGNCYISLPNEIDRSGILYIDKGCYFALEQQVPFQKKVKWVICEEYIKFYSVIDKNIHKDKK